MPARRAASIALAGTLGVLSACAGTTARPPVASAPRTATTVASTAPAAAATPPPAASAATSPPASWGVVADGGVTLVDRTGAAIFTAAPAVATPDGRTVVTVVTTDSGSEVQWLDGDTGAVVDTVALAGRFTPRIVSADGAYAALVDDSDEHPSADPRYLAAPRARTRLAVVGRHGATALDTLGGNFRPEAFTQGGGLALIEYLPPLAPDRYRVRVYAPDTGELALPLSWTDKSQSVDEEMQGHSRTHVLAPDGSALFTLYSQANAGSAGHAFIHTLGLDWARVYCLDLPPEAGFGQHPGAITAAPDSRSVYALSGNGTLVEIRTSFVNPGDPTTPEVVRTLALGLSRDEPGPTVAADATHVYAVVDSTLVTVDRATWQVTARTPLNATVTAMRADASGLHLAGVDWLLQTPAAGATVDRTPLTLPDGFGAVRALYAAG